MPVSPSLDRGAEPSALPPPLDPVRDALFLDLDGTLVPIMPRPDDVRADAGLLDLLERLDARLEGRLAVVSGRAVADLDVILQGRVAHLSGVHGLERRLYRCPVERPGPSPALEAARGELERFVTEHPGLFLEDKRLGLAVHFRPAPEHEQAARAFVAALAERRGLAFQTGHQVVEARLPGADKGTAIAAFLERAPFAGRRPVFVGDDDTDEHGFAVVLEKGGVAVRVGGASSTRAPYGLADPAAVRAWLEEAAGG